VPERTRPLILIADDDPIIGIVASAAIELGGMDVVLASGGEEALALFAEVRPDAVLLDVMMPDLDGYEVCRRLRVLPAATRVPVLMMTALDDSSSIDRAFECGCSGFVTKPLHPVLLVHWVRFQLRAAHAVLAAEEAADRLSRAQTLARLAQWELDLTSARLDWSPATRLVFGDALVDGAPSTEAFLAWVHKDDRARVARALAQPEAHRLDYRLMLPGIGERIVHQEAELVESAGPLGRRLLGATQDVTDLRLAERMIQRMTLEDELTGLPNRESARRALDSAIADAAPTSTVAVLKVGLDNFARINDVFGRPVGDVLLKSFAARLEQKVHDLQAKGELPTTAGDTQVLVGRAGADQFIVLLPGLRDAGEAARVVRALLGELEAPFDVGGAELTVTSSVGVATFPADGDDADVLLERAVAAMNHAKTGGRNQFRFFAPAIQEGVERSHYVETSLRAALQSGQNLALHYQPKVELPSRRATGVEALVRWTGSGPPISPFELVTVAEATGLIGALGDWVLLTGCVQAKTWQEQGLLGIRMAINIAPSHFAAPDFVERLTRVIDEVGLAPDALELEITEGTMMKNTASVTETLAAIKALGVHVALDDFGTGYSSLSYLTTLPIDTLKVDRSFVSGLGKNRKYDTITSVIVGLAQRLGVDVVVEGVETEEQLAFFEDLGTITIQGWYFAKAMPSGPATKWLREQNAESRVVVLRPTG
jgi:diguanylate cyclase (GGDEF)-like protein